MRKHEFSHVLVEFGGFDLKATNVVYHEAEPMVWRYADGSGHPGSPAEVSYDKIFLMVNSAQEWLDITDMIEDLGAKDTFLEGLLQKAEDRVDEEREAEADHYVQARKDGEL